jgi:thiamine kinase-like enzyme
MLSTESSLFITYPNIGKFVNFNYNKVVDLLQKPLGAEKETFKRRFGENYGTIFERIRNW